MKPSHIRTPRTLAECYFVEGYNTVEPAQWQGRWNQPGPVKRNYFSASKIALVISIAVFAIVLLYAFIPRP